MDHLSEFSILATAEARGNFVDSRPKVYYRIQHRNRVLPTDYADFMRCARWETYHTARRREKVGYYLDIL